MVSVLLHTRGFVIYFPRDKQIYNASYHHSQRRREEDLDDQSDSSESEGTLQHCHPVNTSAKARKSPQQKVMQHRALTCTHLHACTRTVTPLCLHPYPTSTSTSHHRKKLVPQWKHMRPRLPPTQGTKLSVLYRCAGIVTELSVSRRYYNCSGRACARARARARVHCNCSWVVCIQTVQEFQRARARARWNCSSVVAKELM